MPADASRYIGTELELFSAARRWKAYWSSRVAPWVKGDVLEVGAGIGANTRVLQNPGVRSFSCLEPDAALAARAAAELADLPACRLVVGTTASPELTRYDSVVYIDVLEHIEDDHAELAHAAGLLRPNGHLVVLAPAYQALYSEFDRAIGHHRRYDAKALTACGPAGLELERCFYLDSVGVLASFANHALLKSERPSPGQIRTWDTLMVPLSRVLDPLFGHRLGKSVVAVWRRR